MSSYGARSMTAPLRRVLVRPPQPADADRWREYSGGACSSTSTSSALDPRRCRRQILASARPRSIRGLTVVAVAVLAAITTIVGAVAALVNSNKLGDVVGSPWQRSSSRSPWSAA